MTRLFIDGYPVTLSEDFEIEYNLENPFFTRNGEYTYDIDIDLKDNNNRMLYGHINRSDASQFPQGREAVVMCDGVVIIRGTEIILSVEEDICKIQIVSGNSELNYLSKGDMKLRDLDFGTFDVNVQSATDSTIGYFPTHNFVCTPISLSATIELDNSQFLNNPKVTPNGFEYNTDSDLVAQPYVLFIIEKLINLLGYDVEINELRNEERWCRLFIVNGYHTNIIADMLPDWSVDEFIDEVEKFFNVIFQVNQFTKSVRIISVPKFYAQKNLVYVDKIIDDSINKDFGVNSPLAVTYDNVKYDFPSYEKYNYMCIDEKVRRTLGSEDRTHYYDYWDKLEQTIIDKKILHCKDYSFDAVGHKYERGLGLDIVDKFVPIINKQSNNETLLKIVPAEMKAGIRAIFLAAALPGAFFSVYARNSNPVDEDSEKENGLHDIIKNGIPEKDATDRLFVAIYAGVRNLFYLADDKHNVRRLWDKQYNIPMSLTDNLLYFVTYWDVKPKPLWFSDLKIIDGDNFTLRLQGETGLYHRYYKNSMEINTSVEYKFSFFLDYIPDQRAIYVIRNQKYYCKSLTTRILPEGRDTIIDGIFYKMNA